MDQVLWNIGMALVLLGLALTVVAMLWMTLSNVKGTSKGKVRGGGAIIIGPVPIIFGTDKQSLIVVLVLSIILLALLLALTVFWGR